MTQDLYPLIIRSTNWKELGYPMLDQIVEFPHKMEMFDGRVINLYDQGPPNLNKGDLIKLSINGGINRVNSNYYVCGVKHENGERLKVSNEYIKALNLNESDYTTFDSFEAAEDYMRKFEEEDEVGAIIADNDSVIKYYIEILRRKGKIIDANGEIIDNPKSVEDNFQCS
ncbi:uncharacterized protein KGF55_004819 [Candida pseudojiufengensis]|uniref:uncharacterized protein n=1 Tax=Candida pseudojiufengensis TaxID=497109 RepID=UPI002224C890|nr:uncharacterized protein KGF55_004819 [Candida pseudojiufengensis]KAI5960096.1 hypothetical protein KGF55_004819 [Candida pseudojiufengensis]